MLPHTQCRIAKGQSTRGGRTEHVYPPSGLPACGRRDAARDSPHPPRCTRRPLPRAGEANTGALLRRANHFVANGLVANGFVERYFAAGGGVAGNVTFGAGANGSMPNFGYASAG